MRIFIVLFIAFSLSDAQSTQYSFPYTQPSDCVNSFFYNSASYQCEPCPTQITNSVPTSDKLSCECPATHRVLFSPVIDAANQLIQLFDCQACGPGQVVTRDKADCTFQVECLDDQSLVERAPNGSVLFTSTCQTCTADTGDSGTSSNSPCSFCPTCSCSTEIKDGVCIEPEIAPDPFQSVMSSWWIQSRGLAAYYGCSAQVPNVTACQVLSSMCAMTLYNQNSPACTIYGNLYDIALVDSRVEAPRTTDMPWLYYSGTVGTTQIVADVLTTLDDLGTVYSFKDSGERQLAFVVAVYSADGRFLGFEDTDVAATVLHVCPLTYEKRMAAFRFGTTYQFDCEVQASTLWDTSKYPNVYYELYIPHQRDGTTNLYSIPVLITNAFQNSDSGEDPIYVRRFAMVDSLVGINQDGAEAAFVRAATSLEFKVTLRGLEGSGEIYVPTVTISYTDVPIVDQLNGRVKFDFSVGYTQDTEQNTSQIEVLIINLCLLSFFAIIWSFYQVGNWRRRQGLQYIEGRSFFMFFLILMGHLANVFFLFMALYSSIRLFIYRGQDIVSLTAVDDEVVRNYITFTGVAFAFKLVEVVCMIVQQSSVDIFFIDWEKSGDRREDEVGSGGGEGGGGVSAWRTFFVANEWNEIQTIRKCNPAVKFFLLILILDVIGFKDIALETPGANVGLSQFEDAYHGVYNQAFRFSVLSMSYLVVSVCQLLFNWLVWERVFHDKFTEFIDLCSVSNISVLILSEQQHGYYIHGRTVHGKADTDMAGIADNMQREKDNLTGGRGLDSGSPVQTFHISVPLSFREQFDRVYVSLQLSTAAAGGQAKKALSVAETKLQAYTTMKNFLILFLDHMYKDMDYLTKDKLFFEQLFDMEFQEAKDYAVFHNDPAASFTTQLFYGREYLLSVFEILFINVLDYGLQNFTLAIILCYIVQAILAFVRETLGRNNLIRKTLVDGRFLI